MRKIDFSSPRVQLALRFFTYGVMAISTVVLTVAAIFYAMGYRFNQGSIEQGGLVQVRSAPSGAQVYVDGKRSDDTPGRAHMSAGTHTVEMQLAGYHSWKRTFGLAPGQLLWLDYTRLVPANLQTSQVKTFGVLNAFMVSPDHRWLLLQETQTEPLFTLADIDDETAPTFTSLRIPETVLTKKDGAYGAFTVVEWAQDSRYFLVRHTIDGQQEYVRVDRSRPAESVNVTTLFRLSITDAHFAYTNANILYANTGDILRKLDIPAANASAALVTGVQQFTVNDDDVISFTAARNNATDVGLYTNNKETVVRSFPLSHKPFVAYSDYYRHRYLAITNATGNIDIVRDPLDTGVSTPAAVSVALDANIAWLDFSDSGRMLVAANNKGWTAYDLELDKTYSTKYAQTIDQPAPMWLDSFYLQDITGGLLRFVDFDGQNRHDIVFVAAGFNGALSANGEVFFSVGAQDTGMVLQATKLTVD